MLSLPGARNSTAVVLLSLLMRRPTDAADFIIRKLEIRLDPLWARPPRYQPRDWASVQALLHDCFPQSAATVDEPALQAIEAEVCQRQADLTKQGPWARAYDADLTLARCLYFICRLVRPERIVETGVAYGLSSAYMLQALHVNGHGSLHSIDSPPLARQADAFIGILVPNHLRARWRLHRGISARKLPAVLAQGPVDLFVHDSSHTYRNMRREFEMVWPGLRDGGVLVADDIECSQAFDELRAKRPRLWTAVQEATKGAQFGIAVK